MPTRANVGSPAECTSAIPCLRLREEPAERGSHDKPRPGWLHWDYSAAPQRQKLTTRIYTCADIVSLFYLQAGAAFSFPAAALGDLYVAGGLSCPPRCHLRSPVPLAAVPGSGGAKGAEPGAMQLVAVGVLLCQLGTRGASPAQCHAVHSPTCQAGEGAPRLLHCAPSARLAAPFMLSFSQEQASPSAAASVPSIFLLAAKLLISFLLL